MSKVRKNVSIDEELARMVDSRDEFNLSGFVNRCLEQHFQSGGMSGPEHSALRAELDRLERELDDVQQRKTRLRERRQNIEERLEDVEEQGNPVIKEAEEKLTGIPADPDNPAVKNWASKAGITPEALIDELGEDTFKDDETTLRSLQ